MTSQIVCVTRRDVRPADDALLRELFEDARPELALLPPDTRFVLLDMQYRAQRRQHRASHPGARHEVLVHDGHDAGRVIIDADGAAIRIIDISVRREYRGRGIATAVLREVLAEARTTDRRVQLSVWSGNADALRLYQRLGFTVADDSGSYLELTWAPRA